MHKHIKPWLALRRTPIITTARLAAVLAYTTRTHLRKMFSPQIGLDNITVSGGVDYLLHQLLVFKEEQDTTGLSLPQKPRPSAAKRAECTPPRKTPSNPSTLLRAAALL